MFAREYAKSRPGQPAVIMAASGEVVTNAELEARSNRLAHLFRRFGLGRGDHYAIFMENNSRYIEACAAGERSGLYYTCVNSSLTAGEAAYIVNNSESRILITSAAKLDVALKTLNDCPKVEVCLVADGLPVVQTPGFKPLAKPGKQAGEGERILGLEQATAAMPDTPIPDESLGAAMLYSSGTTGRPKGVLRALPDQPPSQPLPNHDFLTRLWRFREGMIYLSPAPLYHAAPLVAVNTAIRTGGTVVIMERFDAEAFLRHVQDYRATHSQLVPTMFSRLLKLPAATRLRYDLSSLEVAIHGAAPCPAPVKEEMISWWGPIIHEYYGATEGIGFAACDSEEWLQRKGTVGKAVLGDLHILDEAFRPCPPRTPGMIWFKPSSPFEYFNDPEKTRENRSPDGAMTSVGDIGYVDEEGYLYLTDRASFTIISGGVTIYPQECENLLVTHPKVADAAVFGVPNADLGEEVKAVVQPMPGVAPSPALAEELITFLSRSLSRQKTPRSIDFEDDLPRQATGKLYKRLLRDRYWG